MQLYHYFIVLMIWSIYGTYCYSQYSETIKASNWFVLIALAYGLINNLMWVYLSRSLDQKSTLNYALLWDSGLHFTAFLIPIILFGDKLKLHTMIGMGFIFIGISIVLFYEKINNLT
jgi:drug/metabolite transporter (DMT)-like permease